MGLVIVIAGCVLLYRIAEMTGRSGLLWAVATFFICLFTSALIPWPFIDLVAGIVATWILLTLVSMNDAPT